MVCIASYPDGGGGGLGDARVVNNALAQRFSCIASEHERVVVDRFILTFEHELGRG